MLLCEYGRKNEHICNGVKLAPEYTEEHRGTQEYTGVHRSAQLPLQMISVVIRGMVHLGDQAEYIIHFVSSCMY